MKHRYEGHEELFRPGQRRVWLRVPAVYCPAGEDIRESYLIPHGEAHSYHISPSSWIETTDEGWKNTDPRLDIYKRATIIVARPTADGEEAMFADVETKKLLEHPPVQKPSVTQCG